MKILINKIDRYEGVSKSGKEYVKLNIESAGVKYSVFEGPVTKLWSVGQEIEVEVQEVESNGKIYNNIIPPKGSSFVDTLKAENKQLRQEIIELKKKYEPTPSRDIEFKPVKEDFKLREKMTEYVGDPNLPELPF